MNVGREWWYLLTISAPGRLRQQDHKFETRLSHIRSKTKEGEGDRKRENETKAGLRDRSHLDNMVQIFIEDGKELI